jgi:hypothetical protein
VLSAFVVVGIAQCQRRAEDLFQQPYVLRARSRLQRSDVPGCRTRLSRRSLGQEPLPFLALAFAALPANALAGSILARHAALHGAIAPPWQDPGVALWAGVAALAALRNAPREIDRAGDRNDVDRAVPSGTRFQIALVSGCTGSEMVRPRAQIGARFLPQNRARRQQPGNGARRPLNELRYPTLLRLPAAETSSETAGSPMYLTLAAALICASKLSETLTVT